jgi:predicted nucleotide-binding protein
MAGVFDDPEQVVLAMRQQKTVCSEEVARALASVGRVRTCHQGELLAKQGELDDRMFYVLAGGIEILINQHNYCCRGRNELVGEMAILDPGAGRSADMLAVNDRTVIVEVTAAEFRTIAADHPKVWECIAKEISCRLRERDKYFVEPNEVPVIFVASSSEGSDVRDGAVNFLKKPDRELRPWNQLGIFRPTRGTLEELHRHSHEVDFAIIVVTADDILETRGTVKLAPRDNVMIEFGLFMGALERDRAFLLVKGDKDLKLASDLHGITILYFSNDSELHDRLQEIDAQIESQGRIYRLRRSERK